MSTSGFKNFIFEFYFLTGFAYIFVEILLAIKFCVWVCVCFVDNVPVPSRPE